MKSVVLITGANGLLGSCITEHLSSAEKHQILATDLGDTIFKSIPKNVKYAKLDLVEQQSVEKLTALIADMLNSDTHFSVVHLAAIDDKNVALKSHLPHQEPLEKIFNSFNINTFASIKLMQRFTTLALERGISMSFIYVPSLYCFHAPNPNLYGGYDDGLPYRQKSLAYVSSKGGIVSAINLFASTYARRGLRFNCLVPHGVVNNVAEDFSNQFSLFSPAGRTSMPSDLLPAINFLVDPNNHYYTGQSLFVDGGWSTL